VERYARAVSKKQESAACKSLRFNINKEYAEELSQKRDIFKQHTKTDKDIFFSMYLGTWDKKECVFSDPFFRLGNKPGSF
jgi:hypothetical protein